MHAIPITLILSTVFVCTIMARSPRRPTSLFGICNEMMELQQEEDAEQKRMEEFLANGKYSGRIL